MTAQKQLVHTHAHGTALLLKVTDSGKYKNNNFIVCAKQ